ncbi:NAD-dependent epimerase/dehydratase [Spizellomyces punctatus DAOM BR117]|uniref:NAD-dependent epimerase/dehydratase n=1 Tax=Spizellomyces punctatus (strain DAOM BR117) TaxID=645134 RepID=A0A0L0HCB9_SPIPD|nr:NAD-dependent epimerase/dehydratase [Spizellomyces punctatus DAOM BR117]KNC98418.1 NAD-dependent epimerase/dehydratase [Spizellomyces punctatus DAOM BR117]|eukprot:XP_016606458.1 NAD-dependent epimerase/dehydratase [Spizellomyces punctatus DAOM BR117]
MAPVILVLGGVGFIGRNFIAYIIDNNLVDHVRVADKALPATAYLSDKHKKVFDDKRVEFKQANLTNTAAVEKIFTRDDGKEFDYVFNLAAETKYGQSDEVYDERTFQLSVAVAKEAAKRKVKVFVEVSTAQVYESDKKPSAEEGKLKPWTAIAKSKLKAEEELKKISGLNLVILRPAIVYGWGDVYGITPRLIMGAVYRQLNEKMELLWTKDLKMNTVHVDDVARALWHVAATKEEKGGRTRPVTAAEIYNLADKTDTDQGKVNQHIQAIFGIDTGFQGTMISQFAKLNLESVTEDVNDKHLQPWSELCKAAGVTNTPLTPYLDKELLKDNALSVDGSKIEKELGFTYTVPQLTEQELRKVVEEFVASNMWPKGTTK